MNGKILLLVSTALFTFSGNAQEEKLYFSEALSMYLPKYQKKAKKAFRMRKYSRAKFLFDSLVQHCLAGSYFNNFRVRDLNNDPVHLNGFKKPVFILTSASWIVPSPGKIPALNKLARKYKDQIEFVVIFWDSHKTVRNLAKKYGAPIKVFFVDELQNRGSFVVHNLKHSFGMPTSFLLNKNHQILDIGRSVSHPHGIDPSVSFNLNYDSFLKRISLLLKGSDPLPQNNNRSIVP